MHGTPSDDGTPQASRRHDVLARIPSVSAGVLKAPFAEIAVQGYPSSGSAVPGEIVISHPVGSSVDLSPFRVNVNGGDGTVAVTEVRVQSEGPGDPTIVSYLGHPLRASDGSFLGVISVADRQARRWSADECERLRDLADLAAAEVERRRESQARRLAENHYRRLVETSPSGVFALDSAGRFTEVNPALARMIGIPRDDLIGRSFVDVVLAPDANALRERFSRRLAGAVGVHHHELHIRAPDGSIRIGFVATDAVVDHGRVVGVHGIVRDITEQRKIEEELRASESRYRHLFESMLQGVVYQSRSGRIVLANPAAERILGLDAAGLNGRTSDDPEWGAIREDGSPYPGEEHPAMLALRTGREVRGQVIGIHNPVAGERRWLRVDAVPQFGDGDPEPNAVYTTFSDITEAKQAEERIRFQAELLDSIGEAVIAVDTEWRAIYVNQRAEALYGWPAEELVGRCIDETIETGAVAAEFEEGMARLAAGGSWTGERVVRDRHGRNFPARISVSPITAGNGQMIGAVSVSSDMTEWRSLEEQLRQAQKMEAMGQLTGGVAHDMNNLLTVVLSSVGLLEEAMPRTSGGSRGELAAIRSAAEQAAEMVQKLLAFSRKRELRIAPTRVGPHLRQAARMLERLLPDDVRVELETPESMPAVAVDAGALQQIILNLGTNARDAMPGGGHLHISAEPVHLDADTCELQGWGRPGDFVRVTVSDTGAGMDEEAKTRIFEPFYTTKPIGRGTGLGMAVVYGLMKQHGGFVNVYSEAGRGTAVKLYFPASAEGPAAVAATTSVQAPGGTESILVVEDDAAILRVAERALASRGYAVVAVPDGEEALRVLRGEGARPELIVTDVIMPKLGGAGLYREVRRMGSRARFLFTSGYSGDELAEGSGVPASASAFLPKPWTVPELLHKVREVLDAGGSEASGQADEVIESTEVAGANENRFDR